MSMSSAGAVDVEQKHKSRGLSCNTSAIAAIISYGVTSLAIILFNKMILSVYRFKFEALMMLAQMICCVVFTELLRMFDFVAYEPFKKDVLIKVAPLSGFFVINVLLGLSALRVVNVPMFTTLRRLSGLFILILEWKFLGMKPSKSKVGALTIILAGALIAGSGDLTFDLISYSYVIANNLFTSAYLVAIKKLDNGPKLNAFAKVHYNSLLAIPCLLLIAFFNGEMEHLPKFEFLNDTGFRIAFMISCILAFSVNWATFWCTSVTSPLTTSVTGQCKNILATFLGMFIFGDVIINQVLVIGLSIGVIGSIWFTIIETKKSNLSSGSSSQNLSLVDNNGKDLEAASLKDNNGGMNSNNNITLRTGKLSKV